MSDSHFDPVRDRVGTYYKYSSDDYRKECKKSCCGGYHGHWWEAHHVLPGDVFSGLDGFVNSCLGITNYNINKPYSMGGLPQFNAFILYFQDKPTIPNKKAAEPLKHMRRWGGVDKVKAQKKTPAYCPKYPVHNPVNFGHVRYTEEVKDHLEDKVWAPLKKKRKKNEHVEPENVRQKLVEAKNKFWDQLKGRKDKPGGGGIVGIEENLKHRFGAAKDGWWQPISMTDVPDEPVSA